jgi:predicted aldo/keto reductase-like oxidoreductase
VYCSNCQPCPEEIDIAAVSRYLDIARLDKAHIPFSVRAHYQSLKATGKDCIACGNCEERCPFGVAVIQNMSEAEQLLG